MKHAKPSRAWRPVRAHARRGSQGAWTALLFNICLLLLPAASAAGVYVMARDNLYAYQNSEAGGRAVRARIERELAGLILVDFDRQRQWEDLVAMELMAGDVAAARGFLLSAPQMLPPREASVLQRRLPANATDADIETAALDLLMPGTRARYEATVPLLARRTASGVVTTLPVQNAASLGDSSDFELLARAMLADAETDPLQFVLTGFGLGLAGDLTPRERRGAAIVLAASRREDYPEDFGQDMSALVARAAPVEAFRATALASANGGDAGAAENASAAFRATVSPAHVRAAKAALDEIGAMSEATSPATAVLLLTHAGAARDLPRLRLVAQAGRDRAATAAKRLPHDVNLPSVARGELEVTRDLAAAIAMAGIAAAGLLFCVLFLAFQAVRRMWLRMEDDSDGAELIESFGGSWRPL